MKKPTSLLILIVLSFFICGPARADLKKVGQTGMQFFSIDMIARAAAMGGASMMTGKGASSMFYNPAGMSEMQSNVDFFVTRTNWIADISYNAGGVAKSLGNWGTVGLNFISTDYGEVIGTQVANTQKGYEEVGQINAGAVSVGASYSRSLTDKFRIGGVVKYVQQNLGENRLPGRTIHNRVSGLAYDIGTIFYPGYKSLRVGMSIRNFAGQFEYEETPFELPLTFRISAAMDVLDFFGGVNQQSLLLEVDAMHPRAYTERINLGGEYWFANTIALRAGYKFNYDEEGLSLGFGINHRIAGVDIKLDYSYSDLGTFNSVNRITIGGSF